MFKSHRVRKQHKVYAVKPKRPVEEAAKEMELISKTQMEMERIRNSFQMGEVFRDPIAGKSTADAVCAWSILDTFEDIVKVRKAQFREHLLEKCKEEGRQTDKGGHRVYVESNQITRERRQNKKPNEEDLKILLRTKGIPITECFDEVKTYTYNASKLDYLIESGRLTEQEIEDLKKVTFALKVKQSEHLTEALDNFANEVLGNPPGTKWLPEKTDEENE